MIAEKDLNSCPENVKRYLLKAGVVEKQRKTFAHIIHDGEFRMKPKQKWFPITGEYLFNPEVPDFVWTAKIKVFPLINISVTDQYKDGVGRSVVKLASIFPVANQSGREISESSLGRLLVEFILMPTALVPSKQLHWQSVDANHALVVLQHNGYDVEAIFEFGHDGLPVKTIINRFGNFHGTMKKDSFICDLLDYKLHGGLLIPTDIRGAWNFPEGPFYWFHFKIKTVNYKPTA